MKKINLKRLSSILSEKEMKNVLGGSDGGSCWIRCDQDTTDGQSISDCSRASAEAVCGNVSNAVCICHGG